ncbi:MAG: glycosyltransferase [Marinagarivorans sp.]|nr:glycosyltransferase [Marinagarivorans sp.]
MKDTSPMAVSASIGRLGSLVADPERVRMIRKNLGLTVQDDLRIAYVGGGNMAGTFNQWLRGEHDKGVPVITYSGMMFDIAETLGASLLVGSDFPSQESVAYHDKITFLQLPAPSGSGRLERRLSRIRAGAAAIQGINQFDPHFTIVGADFHWSAIPFLKGIKILSIHCSFWPIDSQPQGLRTKGELCYKGFIYKHFIRGAIGTSASCARQIQQLTDASLVTDSEVPQYSFDPGVKPSRDLQSPVRVLFVGRMEWDKGIEDLLHAVAQLNEEQVLATLTFVGDGSALTAFRKEAELVGKEWVTLAGRLPAREVFQAHAGC